MKFLRIHVELNSVISGIVRFVEDEDSSYWLLERALKKLNIPYEGHRSAEELLERIDDDTSLVFMDLSLPGIGGIDCVQTLKKQNTSLPVVIVSSNEKQESISKALKAGATWYIVKPFDLPDIQCAIENALLVKNQQHLVKSAAHIFANQETPRPIGKMANSTCSVLILGEHGTGKTTLARRIHDLSPRREGAFISVSCANIPRDLFEAELFGFEKGAFTGAVGTRQGLVELANKGTLFLDEIGDLPLELQPKLLTFLQERRSTRIGSRLGREIDTRIIAATNQDLTSLVTEGRFRADLLYRLSVIRFTIPPLRDRIDCLHAMIDTLADRISLRNHLPKKSISKEALEVLHGYPFPGNVRELENVLEQAMILSEGDEITSADLSFDAVQHHSTVKLGESLEGLTLAELEKRAISMALERHGGNRARVARELGITERTLYNKLKAETSEMPSFSLKTTHSLIP